MDVERTRRYFTQDSALFVGPLPPPVSHSHHAVQGCVALDGPLDVALDAGECLSSQAVLIGPDVRHAVSAAGPVAHFYALPESVTGAAIVASLGDRATRDLAGGAIAVVRRALIASPDDESVFPDCLDRLLELAYRSDRSHPPALDARVRRVLERLDESIDAPLAELASAVALSPDRLRHLFRQEVGIPLRRYRRWLRLVDAIGSLQRREDVTAAAAETGFADSAHLSRTFRDAFTVPPREFLRGSRFVQAHPARNR